MAADPPEKTVDLSAEDRQRMRQAHHRLRNASQAFESLVATEPIRGRWAPAPAPPEALLGAKVELEQAYLAVVECHKQLLV